MTVWFTWAVTAICLFGTILNVRKNILCFYFWIAGNLAWLGFDIWSGLYSRAVLDSVQLALAVWGVWEWSRKSPSN